MHCTSALKQKLSLLGLKEIYTRLLAEKAPVKSPHSLTLIPSQSFMCTSLLAILVGLPGIPTNNL